MLRAGMMKIGLVGVTMGIAMLATSTGDKNGSSHTDSWKGPLLILVGVCGIGFGSTHGNETDDSN